MNSPELCPHSILTGDPFRYLRTGDPADRPHYDCALKAKRDGGCTPEPELCPMFKCSIHACPGCFLEGRYIKLRLDVESGVYVCPVCNAQWQDREDVLAEWQETIQQLEA